MISVYKYNSVFDHVEIALRDRFDYDARFSDVVFILGYNMLVNWDLVNSKFPNKRKIIYQLEQLHSSSPYNNNVVRKMLKTADEVWDYDESNIGWMKHHLNISAKFFPLPYVESLKILNIQPDSRDIDVLFIGAMSDRRNSVLRQLHITKGISKIFCLFGVWEDELDEYISRSKIILNVHYFDPRVSVQEQVRMFFPVINNCCVVSERSRRNYMGDSIIESDLEKIGDCCAYMLQDNRWLDQANRASTRFKEISDSRNIN